MRTIRFRGKRVDNGEWVVGSLYQDYDMPECASIIPIGSLEDKWQDLYRVTAYDVDYKSVGQFTGLFDKGGKEIFEDDLIRTYEPEEGKLSEKVIYENGSFRAKCLSDNTKIDYPLGSMSTRYIEVVGNIHDGK